MDAWLERAIDAYQPELTNRHVTRRVATWHKANDDTIRVTVTVWGRSDAIGQTGVTVPDLRTAWGMVAAFGCVHPCKAGDSGAFRAWLALGRR